jgi:hypothetical protein
MNANLLMIGNLVIAKDFGVCRIDAINSKGRSGKRLIKVVSLTGVYMTRFSDADLTGVALTEKHLVDNFGCKKDNYGLHSWIKDDCELWIKKCKHKGKWVFDVCKGEIFKGEHLRYITYVHELENIITILKEEDGNL